MTVPNCFKPILSLTQYLLPECLKKKSIEPTELDRNWPEDPDSTEVHLHVVMSAGRRCIFRAERGHFLEAYW